MKRALYISIISAYVISALSCRKDHTNTSPVSLTIVHAIAGGNDIIPVLGDSRPLSYAVSQAVSYGYAQLYEPSSGNVPVNFVQVSDTALSIFSGTLKLAPGTIYSLFLAGDTTKPDTLLIQNLIGNYRDSLAGLRFINLSRGSNPISVNIQGNTVDQPEFSMINYKQVTSFKQYAAVKSSPKSYSFEIRDQSTGMLLTTFTWSYTRHKNNTAVIAGSEDPSSSTPINVFQINNF